MVENAVGAHFADQLGGMQYSANYWRDRNMEVGFVIETPRKIYAPEVKPGKPDRTIGLEKFGKQYPEAIPVVTGKGGIALENFLKNNPNSYKFETQHPAINH